MDILPSDENVINGINVRIVNNQISYSDFCKCVKPLDVLLFVGDDFVSSAIRKIQRVQLGNGDFSHAGMVVTSDVINDPSLENGKLYTWEITTGSHLNDGVPDIRGKRFLGVQIREFDQVFDSFKNKSGGKIAWCRLKKNPFIQVDADLFELKRQGTMIYHKTLDKPYESICCCACELGKALIPKLRFIKINKHDDEKFFCSEFVAHVLKTMGVLPDSINPSNVVPVDFIPGVDQDKSSTGQHEINCCEKPLYIV